METNQLRRVGYLTVLFLASAMLTGCASWSNPVANGIPASMVPPNVLATPKSSVETIPLSSLRRKSSTNYILAAGDILGVYVEGAIGGDRELPPVSFPDSDNLPPSLGFPIPIRTDGTIPLPLIDPLPVAGMTIEQAEQAVKYAYTRDKKILKEGKQRIIVTIIRPRSVRVLVVRKDKQQQQAYAQTPQFFNPSTIPTAEDRSSNGFVLELPANEADVFGALARSGGLPTDNAHDELLVYKSVNDDDASTMEGAPIRIPFRVPKGVRPRISQDDVILGDGDVVVVDAREPAFYYTAGLLPNREIPLPASYDLTITEALARAGGPLLNGGFGGSNLSGSIVGGGIGSPSPSLAAVIRTLSDGRQVNIRVDLNEAFRDPREDLIVMPDDMIVLQETPRESFNRYLTSIFSFGISGDIFERNDAIGVGSVVLP